MIFLDFSSLAFALMLTFLPAEHWSLLERRAQVRLGPVQANRTSVYFWRNGYQPSFHRWQGLALNVGFLVFLWPIVKHVLSHRGRVGWSGVGMWRADVPKWLACSPCSSSSSR